MNITKRKPVSPGEMLTEEFLVPMGITQQGLADAMGVSRKTVNELCVNRRSITVLISGLTYRQEMMFGTHSIRQNEMYELSGREKSHHL